MRLDQQLGATFLATGEYQISVVNNDPAGTEASYTLVASVDETPTLLRSGTPVFGLASLGRPAFFKFEQAQHQGLALQPRHLPLATYHSTPTTHPSPLTTHPSPRTTHHLTTSHHTTHQAERGLALQLLLTSFAGDPDLCLTRNISALMERLPRHPPGDAGAGYSGWTGHAPPAPPPGASYDLEAATLRFVSHLQEACTWQSSLLGTDVITVSETDAHGGEGA